MLDFFRQIGDFLTSAVDLIVDIFNNLLEFFRIISSAFTFAYQVFGNLPLVIRGGCFALLSVSIIYLIVNR